MPRTQRDYLHGMSISEWWGKNHIEAGESFRCTSKILTQHLIDTSYVPNTELLDSEKNVKPRIFLMSQNPEPGTD